MATNLSNLTRDIFEKSLVDSVYTSIPVLDELNKRKKVITGGKQLKFPTIKDDLKSLYLAYGIKDPLPGGSKSTTEVQAFDWKYATLPLEYDGDVEVQNLNAASENKIVDIAELLSKQALKGFKLGIQDAMCNGATISSTTAYGDSGKNFQSIVNALKHDDTYGGLARLLSAGTRNYYQGADQNTLYVTSTEGSAATASAQTTTANMSIANWRKWIVNVIHASENKQDVMTFMCPTLFNKLKAECQATQTYQGGTDTANVGFNKMFIDGRPIVDWDFLERATITKLWVLILNMNTWEFHINSARDFKMTPFKWQGENINGTDTYLARLLVAGNLICRQPNANMFLSNVS
jgi:hypothetical protein